MEPFVLFVDTTCGKCSRVGRQAGVLSGGRLQVRGLNEPGWRDFSEWDEPVLLELPSGRYWARWRLLARLARVVGPRNALALLRTAGEDAHGGEVSPPRWRLLRGLRVAARIGNGRLFQPTRPRGFERPGAPADRAPPGAR